MYPASRFSDVRAGSASGVGRRTILQAPGCGADRVYVGDI